MLGHVDAKRSGAAARGSVRAVNDRVLRIAIAALALIGIGITVYLLQVRWRGGAILCATGGCDTVQKSEYSEIAGIPVALLGLGSYVALLASALGVSPLARAAGAAIVLTGVAFSGYLLYVQVALIEAVCDWCLSSDVVITLAAAPALLRLHPRFVAPRSTAGATAD